ncbi:MAG: nucleotidyl transferase AbiEii/AbiGii toxin family protein [Propionicimonas sp.]
MKRQQTGGGPGDAPAFEEIARYTAQFGVDSTQIQHDFVISHVLWAVAHCRDRFVFTGGTALSRTILNGLRLSEDIDLLSVGPRAQASILDSAIGDRLERRFGEVTADPWLSSTRTDTDSCIFHIGDTDLSIQLINGDTYPRWPTALSVVEQRYASAPSVTLTTLTSAAFAAAKTSPGVTRPGTPLVTSTTFGR